jgi:hypothetical protein
MFDACTMSQVVMSRKEKNVPITGTIRTVDMLMKNKPRWSSVSSKMHYCVIFCEDGRYRVFAQAKASIRQRQWERLFEAYAVVRMVPVRGFFEDYKPYMQRLNQPHTILEEFGPRPVRLARQTELQVAHNRIRELENRIVKLVDEVTELRGKQKRKAAEMSADESEAVEMSADESEAEEAVEGETTIYYDESSDEDTAHDQSGAEEGVCNEEL